MRYLPHTPEEVAEMLRVIGKRTLDELFETIPQSVRHEGALKVPPALDEATLMTHLSEIAAQNVHHAVRQHARLAADEATGFKLGDLRGLWRVDFESEP